MYQTNSPMAHPEGSRAGLVSLPPTYLELEKTAVAVLRDCRSASTFEDAAEILAVTEPTLALANARVKSHMNRVRVN